LFPTAGTLKVSTNKTKLVETLGRMSFFTYVANVMKSDKAMKSLN